jgi:hypothetical protein
MKSGAYVPGSILRVNSIKIVQRYDLLQGLALSARAGKGRFRGSEYVTANTRILR